MQMGNRLSYADAARFAMRDPRRKCRIQHIHIKRHINWTVCLQLRVSREILHLHHLDAEPMSLLALMAARSPDADLHQPLGEATFHDPRKGTGMGQPVALKLVIQIGVRIKVKDGEPGMFLSECLYYRVGNRMIPAKRNRTLAGINQLPNRPFNFRKWVPHLWPVLPEVGIFVADLANAGVLRQSQVSTILNHSSHTKIDPQLGPLIRSIASHRLADLRRPITRPAKIRRLPIKRDTYQRWRPKSF